MVEESGYNASPQKVCQFQTRVPPSSRLPLRVYCHRLVHQGAEMVRPWNTRGESRSAISVGGFVYHSLYETQRRRLCVFGGVLGNGNVFGCHDQHSCNYCGTASGDYACLEFVYSCTLTDCLSFLQISPAAMAGAAWAAKSNSLTRSSVVAHVLILLCFWDTIVAPLPILVPDDDDRVLYLDSPQQRDKYNCGVYVLAFVEQKVRGLARHPELLASRSVLCMFVCVCVCVYACVCVCVRVFLPLKTFVLCLCPIVYLG